MKQKIIDNLKDQLAKIPGRIISIVVLIAVSGVTIWAMAAFTEPTAGPAASVQDFAKNILGANNADNGFDSSAVVANADGSLVERVEYVQTAAHGCYRKTCSVHNATSCTPTACGGGETDKGTNCPQEGGIWNNQNNSQSYLGWTYAMGQQNFYYGSVMNADYYVSCERWCCL